MSALKSELDRLAGGIRGIRLAFFGDRELKMFVTDHAVIRYLERVRGFSLERARLEIQEICRGAVNARIKKEGFVYVVENGNVRTILPDTGRPGRELRDQVMGPKQRRGP